MARVEFVVNEMWSFKRQATLCSLIILCTVGVLVLVLQNYEKEESATVQLRFFKDADQPRMIALSLLLFLTVMLASCRDDIIILFHMGFSSKCSQIVMGLCHVCIKMVGISLFDFRVIHIMSTSASLRYSMCVADIVSLLLHEALVSKTECSAVKRKRKRPSRSRSRGSLRSLTRRFCTGHNNDTSSVVQAVASHRGVRKKRIRSKGQESSSEYSE